MRARQLEFVLGHLAKKTPADLDVRMRGLRQLGLLPTGGRGLNAPDVDASHVSAMLLAVAGAARAVEGAKAAQEFGMLKEHGADVPQTLVEALTALLDDDEAAFAVEAVRINRTHVTARIAFTDGRSERLFFREGIDTGHKPEKYGSAGISEEVRIGGGTVHQLAIDLAGYNDHEMV